jgi:hypothetical protein
MTPAVLASTPLLMHARAAVRVQPRFRTIGKPTCPSVASDGRPFDERRGNDVVQTRTIGVLRTVESYGVRAILSATWGLVFARSLKAAWRGDHSAC